MTAVPVFDNLIVRYNNTKNQSSTAHLKQVTIALDSKHTENLTRLNLKPITPPKSSANWQTGKNDSKLLDLLRIEERITFNGSIVTGLIPSIPGLFDVNNNTYGTGATYTESTNAVDKKADLKAIFKAGGTCWITYEGQTFSALIEKLDITGENYEGQEPSDGEVGYSVMFTIIKGVDL